MTTKITKMPSYPPISGFEPCATTDPELFFPEKNNYYSKNTLVAKELCRSCPVRSACAEYAINTDVVGIWGATDEKERKTIQKQRKIEPLRLAKVLSSWLPN